VNAAYSWGGAALLVATVEKLTGVRVGVAAPTASAGVTFQAGVNHLDGEAALVYVCGRRRTVAVRFRQAGGARRAHTGGGTITDGCTDAAGGVRGGAT
jgi:hypothetical protein